MNRPNAPALLIIPARMASTRLPGKPLADLHGTPMIVHVWRRAVAAGIGPVVVACADAAIADVVRRAGGRAVLTPPELPSGSDRIFHALGEIDPEGAHDLVVNVQGDLPTLEPELPRAALAALTASGADIATLVAPIARPEEADAENVVKAVVAWPSSGGPGRALWFTRARAPWGEGEVLHHIGLYAYRRAALARFVALPPSPLERRERLEQLRALEAGMTIAVARVDTEMFDVNTPADLERARRLLAPAHPVEQPR